MKDEEVSTRCHIGTGPVVLIVLRFKNALSPAKSITVLPSAVTILKKQVSLTNTKPEPVVDWAVILTDENWKNILRRRFYIHPCRNCNWEYQIILDIPNIHIIVYRVKTELHDLNSHHPFERRQLESPCTESRTRGEVSLFNKYECKSKLSQNRKICDEKFYQQYLSCATEIHNRQTQVITFHVQKRASPQSFE